MFEYIIDEELSLKLKDHEDSEDLYALVESARDHLKEWGNWVNDITDKSDMDKRIHKHLMEYAQNKGRHFVIVYKNNIVGSISLQQFRWRVKCGAIGYWLAPQYQGKGLITRSAKAMLIYGFDHIDLNKIEVWSAEENRKSRNVPERLGFIEEGRRRDYECLDGQYHNMMIYGLLKSEWETQADRYTC